MDDKQALELTVLWQRTNDLLDQMQAAADGHNHLIQDIEAIKERLADTVSRATGNGDEWHYIPFDGEVVPDAELNLYTPEEEARINELEMWGAQGRPRGPWL